MIKLIDRYLPVGPRSVLCGAHCFFVHPLFVAVAWWRLYGFPRDIRLWAAFFVHDLGYLFQWCRNMDGDEGERHVEFGARVMHRLFDSADASGNGWYWHDFCLYHSRFYAKKDGKPFSRLCVADKLVPSIMPKWFYVFQVWCSGEIKEYMEATKTKYEGEVPVPTSASDWYDNMSTRMRAWVEEHKDMREDTWTKLRRES